MVNKILGTTGTRILNAVYNLIILWLISNFVGSEGFGIIGLVIVAITIIQIFVDLLGGGGLIYFASRLNQTALLLISYVWSVIVIAGFAVLFFGFKTLFPLFYSNIIPNGQELNILLLAFLNAFMLTHYNLLIGKGKIKHYNIVFTIQITTLLIAFLFYIFVKEIHNFSSYLNALEISYTTGLILSFIVLIKQLKKEAFTNIKTVISQVLEFGFISQLANGFHILNKRISFYFVSMFSGLSSLGIYNAGVQLTEGLRLIGQSISLVQFSEISNSSDRDFAATITVKLMKLSVLLTFAGIGVLLLIPESIYHLFFSQEFNQVKTIIFALAPGVVALSANTIFSHYFSGLGNPKISLWANIVGFVVTIALALVLIPLWGIVGAALSTSASYSATVIYQFFIFRKQTGLNLTDFMLRSNDFKEMKDIIKIVIKGKKIDKKN